ncbi:MAG: hypothetical protein Q9218_007061, partial [Villophora microphyllina]
MKVGDFSWEESQSLGKLGKPRDTGASSDLPHSTSVCTSIIGHFFYGTKAFCLKGMAQIVYTGVTNSAGVQGRLFGGTKFWLSQKVPSRSRFIEEVKANGGEVTPLEKEADVKIVDHARKDRIPDTYSYRYIELSVRNGQLEELEEHAVGPPTGTIRSPGSTHHPSKGSRTKFTDEDDRILVGWVTAAERSGGQTGGNEIYKQLETKNSRHTWQAWRDRWVKTLRYRPRSDDIFQNPPPTPPMDDIQESKSLRPAGHQQTAAKLFTKDDAEALISVGKDLMNVLPENVEDAWARWVNEHEHPEDHTAQEWQNFWEGSIRVIYLKRAEAAASDSLKAREARQPSSTPRNNQPEKPKTSEIVSLPTRTSPLERKPSPHTRLRSPSYHPKSPATQAQSMTPKSVRQGSAVGSVDGSSEGELFIRGSPKRKRSPSFHPESPTGHIQSIETNPITQSSVIGYVDGPSDGELFIRASPTQGRERSKVGYEGGSVDGLSEEDLFTRASPKRKREPSEDVVEVPSSSPPESQRPRKRFHRDHSGSPQSEVPSIPERTAQKNRPREIPDTYSTIIPEGADVVDLLDAEDSPESFDEEEEDYEEENYEGDYQGEVSRALSPELGRSVTPPSVGRGRVVSETQAAFQEPTPSIEYDLAPPEGGWDDEDEEHQIDELPPPEGGWDDEAEDQVLEEREVVNVESDGDEDEIENGVQRHEEYNQPQAEHQAEAKDEDDSDELGDDAQVDENDEDVQQNIPNVQPNTQAIFNAETQELDLSLPEPEGGWDSVLPPSQSPSPSPSSSSRPLSDPTIQSQIDLQIFAESQRSSPPPSSPPRPRTPTALAAVALPTAATATSPPSSRKKVRPKPPSPDSVRRQVDQFFEDHLALGYDEDSILLVLKCTNMDPRVSSEALEFMVKNGGNVPADMKGFWTTEDDKDLECGDARRVKRVEAKHGTQGMETLSSIDMKHSYSLVVFLAVSPPPPIPPLVNPPEIRVPGR